MLHGIEISHNLVQIAVRLAQFVKQGGYGVGGNFFVKLARFSEQQNITILKAV